LLREEESTIVLLRAWEGTDPTPDRDTDWPAWLEAATIRVANRCASFAKEKKRAKGARTKTFHQKIQLAEIQLQRDPKDETVKNILSASQGNLADTL
jgi:ribosome-binding protein aMBF1 (putative translation factor)